MTWCRAMRLSAEDFVGGGEYGRRHDTQAAVAIIDQPVTGFTGQPRLAIGQQHLVWSGHLQREDTSAQAQIRAGLAGPCRWHRPVLVGKVGPRDAPALSGDTSDDRIARL